MKKRLLAAVLPLMLLAGCVPGGEQEPPTRTADVFAMDTYMTLKASGSRAEPALDAATERIHELETLLSVTRDDSDVSRINRAGGEPTIVAPDTAAVIRTAMDVAADTGNALDIALYPVLRAWGFTTGSYQIPSEETLQALLTHTDPEQITLEDYKVQVPEDYELDLGAVAKGYTGDQILEVFRQYGIKSGIISLGGNVQTIGLKPDGSRWTVGITDPAAPDSLLGKVSVKDCAVITSGNYERFFEGDDGKRYWHILDPANGRPAERGLSSVTVIGQNGARCDALSTALFVMGTDQATAFWREQRGFEMILVTDDGRILATEGIAPDLEVENGKQAEILHGEP